MSASLKKCKGSLRAKVHEGSNMRLDISLHSLLVLGLTLRVKVCNIISSIWHFVLSAFSYIFLIITYFITSLESSDRSSTPERLNHFTISNTSR